MELKFRDIRADEIDVRVGQVGNGWCSLLLYKDARVDMNILDETVGNMNWQRRHSRDNANCQVGIYDSDKHEWVWKEDTGTESNTEAEKGLCSDSFKRACFNVGIGRELYTTPKILINCDTDCEEKNGKKIYKVKYLQDFYVEKINIENKKIVALSIKAYNKLIHKQERVFVYMQNAKIDD